MNAERRGVTGFRRENKAEVGVDFAFRPYRVGAGDMDAVAALWRRPGERPGKVIVFVRGNDEQRVVGGDAVSLQPSEKFRERGVIGLQLIDVAGFAGAEGAVGIRRGAG